MAELSVESSMLTPSVVPPQASGWTLDGSDAIGVNSRRVWKRTPPRGTRRPEEQQWGAATVRRARGQRKK